MDFEHDSDNLSKASASTTFSNEATYTTTRFDENNHEQQLTSKSMKKLYGRSYELIKQLDIVEKDVVLRNKVSATLLILSPNKQLMVLVISL